MAGTKAGGIKCANTNKERHGKDFYKRIGALGGKAGHTGGFASNRELASIAGKKGGSISKRGKIKYIMLQQSDDWDNNLAKIPYNPTESDNPEDWLWITKDEYEAIQRRR